MPSVSLHLERRRLPRPSRRLLALASDDRLVDEVRRGNEAALEVAYERHGRGVLSFSRHMLGSLEEAEEAVQHTFAAAWSDLQRNERPVRLKPWLYAVARNRCLSLLRARRPEAAPLDEGLATAGLADEVGSRADLRALVEDVGDLPEQPRAALVLSELGGLSHADVAEIIGRKEADVKRLVFRARSTLTDWRQARETPCARVREELSVLRGGMLRRRWLSRHLQICPGCREFREQVKAQRRMLAVVLPVTPSLGLKHGVLTAAGLGGGSVGGGAAAAGLGTAAAGSATVVKLAAVGLLAGGALTAGERAVDHQGKAPPEDSPPSAPAAIVALAAVGVTTATEATTATGSARSKAKLPNRRGAGRAPKEHGRSGTVPGSAPAEKAARTRGSPRALGRVKRGLPPPQTGPKPGGVRGHHRRPDKSSHRRPDPVEHSPPAKAERSKPRPESARPESG